MENNLLSNLSDYIYNRFNLLFNKLLNEMKKKFIEIEITIKHELNETLYAIEMLENKSNVVELDQQLIGRLSRMDSIMDQKMSIAKLERQKVRLKQLKQALNNIQTDDFGVCIDCGEDIEFERLQSNPTVKKCFECMKG